MSKQSTVLIVDDDNGIRDLLGKFLSQHNFHTLLAKDGEEMKSFMQCEAIDLIILDIMLPGEDGMSLCRQLRALSSIPIIMLTAISEEIDRIIGLEMGADDYLSKPFNPRELLARIKAILRRSKFSHSQIKKEESRKQPSRYQFNGWLLDKLSRRLTSPEQMEISLSSGEFNLLLAFLERPQQVLSRDRLLDLTKSRVANPFDRSIDIQVSRLRHKIEDDHKNPQMIKTVRGGGYILSTHVERM